MRPYLMLAGATALIVVIGILIFSGDPEDPEVQVRNALRDAVAAAEAQDLGELMDFVSERFESKQLTRQNIKGILFLELRRGAWRRIFLTNTEVDILDGGTKARVKTGAVLASGESVESIQDVVPTDAGSYRFDLVMELEDDDAWRVTKAKYERAPLGAVLGGP